MNSMDVVHQIFGAGPAHRPSWMSAPIPIDGDPPYKAMLAAGLCEVTGFEPQAEALARLEK